MTTTRMKKLSPGFLNVNSKDRLPPKNRLRVQVVTNSKGYLELNLNGRELRAVPPEIFQLTATQVLRLAHNHIDNLPLMIAYLRMLRVLDLQHNLLSSLPETLVNCRHLAELYLTANRLAGLPKSIGGLKNLRVLTLGENQFEVLPEEIGLMTGLRILDVHGNKLWHLPFSLQELKHLMHLNASDNMFDHVPLVVTKNTSLQKLNLAKNRLASLPVDFDALRGLHEVNLSHNCFVSISSLVTSLRHLKYLSLAHNRLKFLPPQMSQLQNLRVLHLQHNNLRHVPSMLRSLQFYNVSSNQLTSFSVEGMRGLVSLSASCNNLDTVPRGLYKLKKLKFLYLDHNQLVELHEDLRQLKELRVLDVSNNQLVSLPRCLHRLVKLQSFNVKDNHKLKQTAEGDGESKKDTVDSASVKHKIQITKEGVMNQKHKLDEHKGSVNISESRSNAFDNDVMDSIDRQERSVSDSKDRTNFNKDSELSDLEMYAKSSRSRAKGRQGLRGTGVSVPSVRADSQLYTGQTRARAALPAGPQTKTPKKVSSLQYLRHLLFGLPKKTKSLRSDVCGSISASNKLSEKSIHFQDSATSSQNKGTRNVPRTRHSTISRNSSSLWSHRKPHWTRSISPDGSSHEPLLANRIHFNIPDDRSDYVDANSDSHGYGTWRSRHRSADRYLDRESLDYSGSSSYSGQHYTPRPLDPSYNDAHTQGNGDYRHATYAPNEGFYFSSDHSYGEGDSRNKNRKQNIEMNTRQYCNNNDSDSQCFRNKCVNSVCHCSSPNYTQTIRGERSSNDRRRNNFNRNSSTSTNIKTQDRSSFVSGKNVKATEKHGDQHRSDHRGFTSQPYTTPPSSFPESELVNSSKRMTIPQVGCWYRDEPVNSPRSFSGHTGQLGGKFCLRGHSHPHIHHDDQRESSLFYHSDPASDVDQNYIYGNASLQRQDKNFLELRGKPKVESNHGRLQKNCSEFDHVLMTRDFTDSEPNNNEKAFQRNDTNNTCLYGPGYQESKVGDSFIRGRNPNPTLSHSRSVDSLMELASRGNSLGMKGVINRKNVVGGAKPNALAGGFSEMSVHSDDGHTVDAVNQGGTDYSLLGVCSQVETLLNRNLLQPVIGYQHRGRHSFAEKTIRENAQGLWRMDDRADVSGSNLTGDNAGDDDGDDDVDDESTLPGLEYTQPQTFAVTSQGGKFVSSAGPRVEISLPAHATIKPLHITVQLMFVPSIVLAKVKELNYFVNNIVAMGPVVYFHSATAAKLNSPATVTIPAPADVKGGHLIVLTVRKDNSCIPCSSGYRSGRLTATFTTWQFVGKVAIITEAKCKYKACKSMEQLLQCVGATHI